MTINDGYGPGGDPGFVVYPVLPTDPPKVGDYWLDARLLATPAGVAFVGHGEDAAPVCLILLSDGGAHDAAARDRFAGTVNELHIDTVVARGGHGQDEGRLAAKFRSEDDDPVDPDDEELAPWVAILNDGSSRVPTEAQRILDQVEMSTLPPKGTPAGPGFRHHWIDNVKPGLSRLWPLPWPGRYDRASWISIAVSWLLMVLIAALAVLIAIIVFQNTPSSPPPPSQSPASASSSPQSGSPSPQSGSPSPQSGSPSPQSGSPSPQSGSPSPQSGSPTPEPSGGGSPRNSRL